MEKNTNTGSDHANQVDMNSFYFLEKVHERYINFLSISQEVFANFQKENDNAILDYRALDFYIQDQDRPDNYKGLQLRLEKIQEVLNHQNHLNHDPICWIAYLYYFESMSVAAISKTLEEFGIIWKAQALSHFLKNTLSWRMRSNTHITEGGKHTLSYLSVFRDRVGGIFTGNEKKDV